MGRLGYPEDAIGSIGRLTTELEGLLVTEAGRAAVRHANDLAAQWKREEDVAIGLVAQGKNQEAWTHTVEKANPLVDQFLSQAATSMQLVEQLEAMVGRAEGRVARAAKRPAARPSAQVMTLGTASKGRGKTPEQQIPLDDQTGPFGSF